MSIHQNLAAVRVVETAQKIHDGGFTRTRRSDKGYAFSRLNCKIDVVKNLNPLVIAKVQVFVFNLTDYLGQFVGPLLIGNGNRLVYRFKNALHIGNRRQKIVDEIRQCRNGLPEAADVCGKCNQGSDSHPAETDLNPMHTQDKSQCHCRGGNQLDKGTHQECNGYSLEPGRPVGRREVVENLDVLIFPDE